VGVASASCMQIAIAKMDGHKNSENTLTLDIKIDKIYIFFDISLEFLRPFNYSKLRQFNSGRS